MNRCALPQVGKIFAPGNGDAVIVVAPKYVEEEARLAALNRYAILDTEDEEVFDDIVRLVAELCDAPIAVINLIDRDRQWFKSEVGLGVRETPLDISICSHAILQPDVLVVPDLQDDERFTTNPLVTGDPHLRFYAGALLESSDGYPLGTLCVLDYKPRALTEQQERVLRLFAREVMSHMELRLLVRAQATQMEQEREAQETLAKSEEKHRHIAEVLQDALLLAPPKGAFPGLDVATYYEGAWDEAEVAGDFFDAFALDAGLVALVVGDVTGKGLEAASYTAEIKYALRAFLRESPNPARAMYRLNHYLIEAKRLDVQRPDAPTQYVALSIAVVEAQTGEVHFSAAGAEPPVVIRSRTDATAETVEIYGPLLGVDLDSEFGTVTTTLEQSDLLVMVTDGVTEMRKRERGAELFGYERFSEAAREASLLPSLDAAAQKIVSAALGFADNHRSDDICLLLARRE